MPYNLAYSFNGPPSLSIIPRYIDASGVVGDVVTTVAHFELTGWYGFTLTVSSGYRGFVGFFSDSTPVALFAINPQEGENMDAKVSLLSQVGPGGVGYTYHAFNALTNFPVVDAKVWATTDVDGLNVVGGTLTTDSNGDALFELPAGVYYFWVRHSRYKFNNPERIVVA